MQRKLREVSQAEYLLVPFRLNAESGRSNPCAGYLKSIRSWFLYPANLPCRADPLDPAASLKSFILEHYKPVVKIGSWWVLRKADESSSAR